MCAHRLPLLLALIVLAVTAGALHARAEEPPAGRELRDDTGATVRIRGGECRIVSLAPGTTAMLFAAGAGHCLIGTIAHSQEPPEAARVPIIGDAETLDFERLVALRPTVVVAAVDVVQRMRIDRIRSLGIPVYQVHVTRLDGMPESVRRLGSLAGSARQAEAAAETLRRELHALRMRQQGRKQLRVLYQIWDRPIYTVGGRHVISDALRLCGATNVFEELGTAAPAVTRESVLARNPQLIIASAPAGPAAEWLDEWRRFPSLAATRDGRLIAYTDERIDRMGPSLIAATADLCAHIDRARGANLEPTARMAD
jgi:iron complex transport system substrate-binding protein